MFDTSDTGDDWDNYVPEELRSSTMTDPSAPPAMHMSAAPVRHSNGDGLMYSLGKMGVGGLRIIGVLVFLGAGTLFTLGSTSWGDLKVGDCFNMPADAEFASVDSEGCDSAHDSQIYGALNLPGPDAYPGEFDPYWQSVLDMCATRLETALIRQAELPFDLTVEIFTPNAEGWAADHRTSHCIIWSPGGLEGSFVNPVLIP